jgi:hypothetical protein
VWYTPLTEMYAAEVENDAVSAIVAAPVALSVSVSVSAASVAASSRKRVDQGAGPSHVGVES